VCVDFLNFYRSTCQRRERCRGNRAPGVSAPSTAADVGGQALPATLSETVHAALFPVPGFGLPPLLLTLSTGAGCAGCAGGGSCSLAAASPGSRSEGGVCSPCRMARSPDFKSSHQLLPSCCRWLTLSALSLAPSISTRATRSLSPASLTAPAACRASPGGADGSWRQAVDEFVCVPIRGKTRLIQLAPSTCCAHPSSPGTSDAPSDSLAANPVPPALSTPCAPVPWPSLNAVAGVCRLWALVCAPGLVLPHRMIPGGPEPAPGSVEAGARCERGWK